VAGGKTTAREQGAWLCFEDEAGAWVNPPVRRTWGLLGQTPVIKVSGKTTGKISMVAWTCYRDGEDPRMIFAIKPEGGYTKEDFPRLLALLHRRLGGPVVVIWDNYSSHVSKHVKEYTAGQEWLTIIQMPAYAPDLNPVEWVWSHAKTKIANRAFRSIDELTQAARAALRHIQHHPELLSGFLTGTRLDLTGIAASP
jgi:putative transposase